MKHIILTITLLLAFEVLSYDIQHKSGRVFITPSKVQKLELLVQDDFSSSSDLVSLCKKVKQRMKSTVRGYKKYQCENEGSDSFACSRLKKFYQKIALEDELWGFVQPVKSTFWIHDYELESLNKEEISRDLGLELDRIVLGKSKAISNIEDIIPIAKSVGGHFSYAMSVMKDLPKPHYRSEQLIFNDRLSACAFISGELSLNSKITLTSRGEDSIPTSGLYLMKEMQEEASHAYSKISELSENGHSPHDRAYGLMKLGLVLNRKSYAYDGHPILKKFPKLSGLSSMKNWWNLFFKTSKISGKIDFKELNDRDVSAFYPVDKHTLFSTTHFSIESENKL